MPATLRDYYNTGDNNYLWNTVSNGQTFTPTENYNITSVKLKLLRGVTAPGTLTVNIYATVGGLPTGSVLASGTTNGTTLTQDTAGEWREITLTVSYFLLSGVMYAIVLNINANAGVRYYSIPETYEPGDRCYFDDPDWITVPYEDWVFETWGTDAAGVTLNDRSTIKRLVAVGNSKIYYEVV